jgi:hypothetical protein
VGDRPGTRDTDLVLHGVLGAALLIAAAVLLLFAVPALFDRHDSVDDLAALALAVGVPAVTFLLARRLWRSWTMFTHGDDR